MIVYQNEKRRSHEDSIFDHLPIWNPSRVLPGTAVIMILAMDTFLYITLVFSSALYTITNRSSFSPSNGPTLILCDNPKSGTGSKGTKVENSSLRMVKQQNVNKMMKSSRDNSFNPPGSLISGNSPRFSAAPSGAPQSVDTTHQGSSHESKYSVTSKKQLLRIDRSVSTKTKVPRKSSPHHSIGTADNHIASSRNDVEKKVLLKMKRLLFVAYTLLPTIFLVSLATFTMQLQASETYSEIIETENRRYDPFFEIITFAAILTTGVFLYYALGK
eukprot:jgi/Bigna1/132669/aug1.18_g7377